MAIDSPSYPTTRATHEDVRAVIEATSVGKWALVHDGVELDTFDSFADAAARAVEEFGVGSYLVRTGGVPTVTLPSSVVFPRS